MPLVQFFTLIPLHIEGYIFILYILDIMKFFMQFNEFCTWHTCRYFLINGCFKKHETFLTLIISHDVIYDSAEMIHLFLRTKQKKLKNKRGIILSRIKLLQQLFSRSTLPFVGCILEIVTEYLLMTPNWEEWWIHQKVVLPFSVTWTGWKVGQRGT